MALFDCTCEATSGHARALSFETAHGTFQTPMFMPVGTSATVKGVTTGQLRDLNSQVVLANTYHLSLRPGADVVAEAGGVHRFMNYDGPMLTDSGGFQVFSLADTVKLSDDGVTFQSIYDGSKIHWRPRRTCASRSSSRRHRHAAGPVRPLPRHPRVRARAVDYSSAWARRCLAAHTRSDQTLFGIVQGGIASDVPVLLCADDLAPSETIQLDKSKVLGFITAGGSGSSHTAILARTLGIPAIVAWATRSSQSWRAAPLSRTAAPVRWSSTPTTTPVTAC